MIGTLIIKRDGRLEKWNSDKIESAVTRALMATDPGRDLSEAEDITTTVADQLEHLLEHIPEISFSDLHDLVEVELMKYDPHAAKNYIIYRKNHNDIRETKDALLTTIDSIAKETSKDNGNVRNSPSAKIYEIGSAASNWYADTKVLESEAVKAHYEGRIHIHDKNFYTLTYNCLVVPLEKMLKDGFRMPNGWINEPKRIGSASSLCAVIVQSIQGDQFGGVAINDIDKVLAPYVKGASYNDVYQAMEALLYNLSSLHSRCGGQVPFSSLSMGADTTEDGRMVTKAILEAYDKGMGKGTAFIFPNLAYKLAADINFREGTPNYDLTLLACKVAAHRMNPMFIFCDASFNKPWGTTINYMGCRSRTGSNVHGPAIIEGRGNVSFTTLNLVSYALEAKGNVETFFSILDENLGIVERQLLHRYNILSKLKKRDIPFNMDGIYYGSDDLKDDDIVEPALKHGTHTFGFTGLAECLKVLLGVHHGESEDAQALGLRIVGRVRAYADYCTDKHNLNFSVIATPNFGHLLRK